MNHPFQKRIGFNGDLREISRRVCADYGLGSFVSSKVADSGYEDLNFCLETAKGKYFVKVFNENRTENECYRLINIINKARLAGVKTPGLLENHSGFLDSFTLQGALIRLLVLEFVQGKTFFDLHCFPNASETKFLARQAALINSINYRPSLIYDEWALENFPAEFEKKKKFLAKKDLALIKAVLEEYESINPKKLPHAFIHADMHVGNILRGKGIWVIDFAVANYSPRIYELAVLAMGGLQKKNIRLALEEYQKHISLSEKELEAFPILTKAASAMYLLLTNYHKKALHSRTKENEYWLDKSRQALLVETNH